MDNFIFKKYELFFTKMINLGENKKAVKIMEISCRICLNNILWKQSNFLRMEKI